MVIFDISYSPQKGLKRYYPLFFSSYVGILGLIFCVKNIFAGNYDLWLYCFAGLPALSAAAILALTLCRPKPLASITSESLSFNIGKKIMYRWDNIREISIGISSLQVEDTNRKSGYINLESIRYSDLKMLKSKIIEQCEAKKIPYKNDY